MRMCRKAALYDQDEILERVCADGKYLLSVPQEVIKELPNRQQILLAAVPDFDINGSDCDPGDFGMYLDEDIRDDTDFAVALINANSGSFALLSNRLRNNGWIIVQALDIADVYHVFSNTPTEINQDLKKIMGKEPVDGSKKEILSALSTIIARQQAEALHQAFRTKSSDIVEPIKSVNKSRRLRL